MSPEEFDAIRHFRCGFRYELIDGVLIVSPPPGIGERDPNEELGHLLRTYRESHPLGSALDATVSEQEIAVGANRRQADRVIWTGLGRTPDPETDILSIVIEFVSKSRRDFVRDYQEKRAEYRAAGVSEYWIMDRFRRTMTVYRATSDAAEAETIIPEGGTYRTTLLPGFELPLARLLTRADLWQHARKPTRPTPPEPKPAGETDG